MKQIKVSILALSVLVGGAVFASAAANKTVVASTSDIVITNVAPLVWSSVSDLPTSAFLNTTNASPDSIVIVDTDANGKITGVANIIKNWTGTVGTNTNSTVTAQSSFFGQVKGSIKASKMGQPTIQITLNAKGYSAPTTNAFIINNQSANGGLSTLNVNFKSTTPAVLNTNLLGGGYQVVGTSKIQFKPGIAAIVGSNKSFSETATLNVDQSIVKELDARVVVFGNKFGTIMALPNTVGGFGNQFIGAGDGSSNSKGAYSVNVKGQGNSQIQLKGQTAAFNVLVPGATNSVTTISTATEKGKIQGQAVEGQGFFSTFSLFE